MAQAASRAGSTRRSSSSGLCLVRCQSGSSMRRKTDRASSCQLHQRLVARVASPSIRGGKVGNADSRLAHRSLGSVGARDGGESTEDQEGREANPRRQATKDDRQRRRTTGTILTDLVHVACSLSPLACSCSPMQRLELHSVRLARVSTFALLEVGGVLLVVAFVPDDLAVTLEGEDMGSDTIEEPAIVADHHGAAGETRAVRPRVPAAHPRRGRSSVRRAGAGCRRS